MSESAVSEFLTHPFDVLGVVPGEGERLGWVSFEDVYDQPLPAVVKWPAPMDMAGFYPEPRVSVETARDIVATNDGNPYLVHLWVETDGGPNKGLVEVDTQAERADWAGPDADGLYRLGCPLLWEVWLPCQRCGRPVHVYDMPREEWRTTEQRAGALVRCQRGGCALEPAPVANAGTALLAVVQHLIATGAELPVEVHAQVREALGDDFMAPVEQHSVQVGEVLWPRVDDGAHDRHVTAVITFCADDEHEAQMRAGIHEALEALGTRLGHGVEIHDEDMLERGGFDG